MIEIDKGVPIPPPRKGTGRPQYPWRDMEVGDSFFIVNGRVNNGKGDGPLVNTRGGAVMVPGSKWTMRVVVENEIRGIRIWRIA